MSNPARLRHHLASPLRAGVSLVSGLGLHLGRSDLTLRTLPGRIIEQARLLAAGGVQASEYYKYQLYRPTLPWARKREFIGSFQRWRWGDRLNPPAYRYFSEDKLIFKRYMAAAGIPVAGLVAVVGPNGRAETGEPLDTPSRVRDWLRSGTVTDIVLKPLLGARGAGILSLGALDRETGTWHQLPEGRATVETVMAHLAAYAHRPHFLVEERLHPHPALAELGPNVLHSARVLTALDHDGVIVFSAALRIGSGRTAADNFSQGNLAAPIDLATGRLGIAALSKLEGHARVSRHPMTGAPIEGLVLPDWAQGLDVVRAAAAAVPFNALLGWDLALSSRGPVVVEANDLWDTDVSQIAPDRGLLATALGDYLDRHDALGLLGLGRDGRPRGRQPGRDPP